jgi:hypothetical protein
MWIAVVFVVKVKLQAAWMAMNLVLNCLFTFSE